MTKSLQMKNYHILFPVISLLIASPYVFSISPSLFEKFSYVVLVSILPFYIGLLASPGYLYFWIFEHQIMQKGRFIRKWVEVSLWLGLIASALGLQSIPILITIPFVLGSTFSCVKLLRLFYEIQK